MKDIQLWHGDCLKLMADIEPESVSLILTDPPYAVLKHRQAIKRHRLKDIGRYQAWDDMTVPEYYRLILNFSRIAYDVAKDGATIYCFCGNELTFIVRKAFERAGWHWRMVNYWRKTNPAPVAYGRRPQSAIEPFGMATKGKMNTWNVVNGGLAHNVIDAPSHSGITRIHPTQKPISVCEELIRRSSNEDDLVLDPFMGSGVTMKACLNLNRRGIGIEIRQDYYDVAKADLEKYLL